jgi:hypothetical protein
MEVRYFFAKVLKFHTGKTGGTYLLVMGPEK